MHREWLIISTATGVMCWAMSPVPNIPISMTLTGSTSVCPIRSALPIFCRPTSMKATDGTARIFTLTGKIWKAFCRSTLTECFKRLRYMLTDKRPECIEADTPVLMSTWLRFCMRATMSWLCASTTFGGLLSHLVEESTCSAEAYTVKSDW